MFFPKKSAILFLLAASFVWAQQETATGTGAQGNAATVEPSPNASSLPDSTKLEPLKMKKADYPLEASTKGIQGQVIVQLHISETGDVESVDVLSGDPILAESAVKPLKSGSSSHLSRTADPPRWT